jgi:type II secretory pathway predicted ATPase ExeA
VTQTTVKRRSKRVRPVVVLDPTATVASMLNVVLAQLTSSPQVKVAVSAFCEGRRLRGDYALQITGASLVPVDPPALPAVPAKTDA